MKLEISGFEDLDASLAAAATIKGEQLRPAVRAAAEVVRDAMARAAPRSDEAPHLAENIVVEELTSSTEVAEVAVGPTREFFYGGILEHGNDRLSARPWAGPAAAESQAQAQAVLAEGVKEVVDGAFGGNL